MQSNCTGNTVVGENGTQLFGGLKQKVAIARELLKDPRILLLNEATRALDAEFECVVRKHLTGLWSSTTVIIAHRLSTVRNVDMIAVIHQGSIVEKGSHSELLNDPNGKYSQLIRLQAVNKESEQHHIIDNDKPEIMLDYDRQLSLRAYFQ
ncbi:hypothetical protein AAC387_Pa04g1084 [Persea americana]